MLVDTSLAALVLDHSEYATIFDRYRIDYCCKGERTLRTACEERGLDVARVVADCELAARRREPSDPPDPRTLSTRDLIVRVIARHHQYLHRTLPFLQALSQKVSRVHGAREPSVIELARRVDQLATTLTAHLADEERVLFPALIDGDLARAAPVLATMRSEHEAVGEMLAGLRTITSGYVPPAWGCGSYQTLFAELAHLEADTLRHVHVENHVLLPRFVGKA